MFACRSADRLYWLSFVVIFLRAYMMQISGQYKKINQNYFPSHSSQYISSFDGIYSEILTHRYTNNKSTKRQIRCNNNTEAQKVFRLTLLQPQSRCTKHRSVSMCTSEDRDCTELDVALGKTGHKQKRTDTLLPQLLRTCCTDTNNLRWFFPFPKPLLHLTTFRRVQKGL